LSVLIGAIAQVPLGRLSDRIDRRLVLVGVGLNGVVAGILMMVVNPEAGPWLYILIGLYGLSANSLYAIAVAHANDFASHGEFGKIASGMLLILGAGTMIGPIAASLLMERLGPWALFFVPIIFHAVLALAAFLRMQVRPRASEEERAPFQPIPTEKTVTAETIALDPRTEETETLDEAREPA